MVLICYFPVSQFLEPQVISKQFTVNEVDNTAIDNEFICLLEEDSYFDRLTISKQLLKDSFNMDRVPDVLDLKPCLPFTANMIVEGLTVVSCEILSVPDSLQVSVDETSINDDEIMKACDESSNVQLDNVSMSESDNALLEGFSSDNQGVDSLDDCNDFK